MIRSQSRVSRLLFVLAGPLALSACNPADTAMPTAKKGLTIEDAHLVLPAVSGGDGAAYFKVNNGTDGDVKIVTIDVQGANMAMMHETLETGGHSTMQMLGSLTVPAHGSVAFEPGHKHVMVSGISKEIAANTMTRLTLTFDDGDKAVADLPVVPPGAVAGN